MAASDCDDGLATLRFIEHVKSETSFKHGIGQKTNPVVQIAVMGETNKPVDKLLTSKPNAPPSLVAMKKDGEVVNIVIVADANSIVMDTVTVEEAGDGVI